VAITLFQYVTSHWSWTCGVWWGGGAKLWLLASLYT